jgi:hypothetical protein
MTDAAPPTTDIATVPIDDLIRHPDTPRRGDIPAISASIEVNGWYGAVVAQSSTRHVLAGNNRMEAARRLGMTDLPVHWLDVDDATARRIMLADNRTSDLATYDDEVLVQLLAAAAADDDLFGTGFDGDDLDALLAPAGDFDYGNVSESLTPAERLPAWEAGGIRSLILPFPVDGFGEVVEAMADARARLDVDNNSDALRGLLGL